MNTTGKLMNIGLIFALFGIFFKLLLIEGSGLLLTLALLFLSILSFAQFFIALVQIKNNKTLKIIAALLSYAFSISFVGILFRFQWWEGRGIMLLVSTIAIVVLTIIFVMNRNKMYVEEYKSLIKVNLLIPWCFIMLFTTLHYILSDETFYNIFSSQREVKTYE